MKRTLSVLLMAALMTALTGCSSVKTSASGNDVVAFFTEENKPELYREYGTPPHWVSVNTKDDLGSGDRWAAKEAKAKIREQAIRSGYDGVIMGKLIHYTMLSVNGNIDQQITYYYQYYTPIYYNTELYPAPADEWESPKRGKKERGLTSSLKLSDLLGSGKDVAVFTEENKPDDYEVLNGRKEKHMFMSTSKVSANDMRKIRKEVARYGYNGVIMLDPVECSVVENTEVVTRYYQTYIPIIYNPQL